MIHRGKRGNAVLLAVLLSVLPVAASAQISSGQIANFEDGTTQGWLINLLAGMPFPSAPPAALPVNVATGGPAGAGDNYLRLTSLGGTEGPPQPGSRLMVLNPGGGWGGNWLTAGITSIRMAAINLGNTDLQLRFQVENPMFAPPTAIAVTNAAISLTAGSGWQTVEFQLFGPSGLVPVLGTVNDALTTATAVRIYHSPLLASNGPPIIASLGLDNITAVNNTVPEPSTVVLLGIGAMGLLVVGRKRLRS